MREKRHAARRAARTAVTSRFVVLTGVSGSGKSQAIRALEDLGYFCVDNLPVTLLPMLAELTMRAGSEIGRAAVVVDVREGKLLSEFPAIYKRLKAMQDVEPKITVEALKVLSVESSVKSRTSYGGTAPKNVMAQAKAWAKRLEKERK